MLKNKSILAVIPARGSKGYKIKNIQKINGTPLISFIKPILNQLSTLIWISTDSLEIAKVAEKSKDYPFLFLDQNIFLVIPFDLVLRHALKKMEKINKITL